MHHIIVVDDDSRIRALLAEYLRDQHYVVSTASNSDEAMNLFNYWIPDLMILDIMMPGETGIVLTEKIRAFSPVPILMLTALEGGKDRIHGLMSGADDYVTKPFEPKELLLRVERIIARTEHGGWQSKPAPVVFGDCVFDPIQKILKRAGDPVKLSVSEVKILEMLSSSRGKPVSRDALASQMGGVEERTVDVQMIRLRQKLEKDPKRPAHLQTIRGLGYCLQE